MSGHDTPAARRRAAFFKRHGGSLAVNRLPLQATVDGFSWVVGLTIAQFIRFDFSFPSDGRFGLSSFTVVAASAAGLQVAIGLWLGLYRNRWRYGSIDELGMVVVSVAIVGAILTTVTLAGVNWGIPASVALGSGLVTLAPMVAVRYGWRMLTDLRLRPDPDMAVPVVMVGAGEVGSQLVQNLLRNPHSPLFPVAFVDDDPAKQGLRLKGVPVEGTVADLATVAARNGATQVVVSIPSASPRQLRIIADAAAAAGLPVQIVPPVAAVLHDPSSAEAARPWPSSPLTADAVRPVTEADLLGRAPANTDIDAVAGYLSGKRVLVTGAGGSIGSELCRQIHTFAPAELIMLDRDESALHAVQLSIDGRGMLSDDSLVVADIRDRQRLLDVFSDRRPHVVFHAAALKHVSLLEKAPTEGVKTNVLGTQNVLDAAMLTGVERFVNVSTDKAANPCNVLGYTKRIAERLTAEACDQPDRAYMSVRFGNVLGSRGSMLEAFRAQIEAGGPVLVTDPDVSRFFMTTEEAVQLMVHAGAIGSNGEALVLDMGEPVRILDVARRLIAEAEANGHPAGALRVEFTGLRPGEKLHEELFDTDETPVETSNPLITTVEVNGIRFDEVCEQLKGRHEATVVTALAELSSAQVRPPTLTSGTAD